MKPSRRHPVRLLALSATLLCALSALVIGQDAPPAAEKKKSDPPANNAASPAESPAKPAGSPAAAAENPGAPNQDGTAKASSDKAGSADEIQLSLQGANIDMVVQWLAQTTGKTVIKHPRVQCQLTITS